MAGDLLGISISGLLVSQRGLAVTGHNVSNANTAGYSRQRVDQVTRPPTPSGDGYIGNGATVNTVERVLDQFINGQLTSASASNSQLQEFYRLASQVDSLLADPQAGLTPNLQNFFNAVNDLADDPSSATARQVLLSEAQAVADRFHHLDSRLNALRDGVNVTITNTVSEINELAAGIARLNRDIVVSQGIGPGQPANDLLDRRDELIRQLSERVAVTTVAQDDGMVNVFIGSGQTLVAGTSAIPLSVVNNPYDASRKEVAMVAGATTTIVSDLLTGGTLGGAMQFRRDLLDPAQNALGRTALGLSTTFNAQHRLGQNLGNALGGDFFRPLDLASPTGSPRVLTSSAATVTASVTDVSALTTSDYRLDYNGATYSLLRLSDNAVVYSGAAFPPAAAVDGVTYTLAGAPAAGDSFLIQPTRAAANDFALALSDPSRIAAAAPVRTRAAANANGVPTNIGSGRIGEASVSNTTNLPLAGPITLTFNAAANQFIVAGGPGGTLAYNPVTDSNGVQFSFAGYGGITFTVSGVPADGDSFVIENNTGGASDNRNALALAALRDRPVLVGGTTSIEASYGQLVTDVGVQTHAADISRNAQQTLLNRVTEEREAVSGVNLDEEAANMLRYQQAYQAAAQMIAVADSLFQELISAVRR
jgi:flagellar hook-associated protein 1 FlgK